MVQEQVYQTPLQYMAELQQRLMGTWAGFQQSVVDEVFDQWQKRLNMWCIFSCTRRSVQTVACCVFHDCIKLVESLTFLTLWYCCKLLKWNLLIWQDSVVAVLRQGGQNISTCSMFPLDVVCQILLKSVDVWTESFKKLRRRASFWNIVYVKCRCVVVDRVNLCTEAAVCVCV